MLMKLSLVLVGTGLALKDIFSFCMSLSLGIVGLPNVGKSTLFNALTRSKLAPAENYPFCTIEPNIGIVEVPDDRLAQLSAISKSEKTVPAAIRFVDIAGLVKGASEGAGLGNKFLAHIREVDAIVQVVRAFTDTNIIHVNNKVDPADDASVINLELILADLETVTKRFDRAKKSARGVIPKETQLEIAILEKLLVCLGEGKRAATLVWGEEEAQVVKELQLLTTKPMMYVVNIDEPGAKNRDSELLSTIPSDCPVVNVCARLEAELSELTPAEGKEYMTDLGMHESGLDQIIRAGYALLNLVTYFTSGEPETRAWTISKDMTAPLAAGVIHTDFIKGFVKADVTGWADFVSLGGWGGVRDKGKLRVEGKEYVVRDGDVCYFHIA